MHLCEIFNVMFVRLNPEIKDLTCLICYRLNDFRIVVRLVDLEEQFVTDLTGLSVAL